MILRLLVHREYLGEDIDVKLVNKEFLDLLCVDLGHKFGVLSVHMFHRLLHFFVEVLQDLMRV